MHFHVTRFDTAMTLLVERLPTRTLPIMTAASAVGLPIVIIISAVLLAVSSWLNGSSSIAYALIASLVALGGNTAIKHTVRRARPDTLYVGNMKIQSYSFPSGHTFGSTVFYGLLAYLAYVYLPLVAATVTTVALVLLIILIGISRIYLGAHFPSDVLLGWILGGLSLLAIVKFIV